MEEVTARELMNAPGIVPEAGQTDGAIHAGSFSSILHQLGILLVDLFRTGRHQHLSQNVAQLHLQQLRLQFPHLCAWLALAQPVQSLTQIFSTKCHRFGIRAHSNVWFSTYSAA